MTAPSPILLTGSDAVARGAWSAGAAWLCGATGTPVTEMLASADTLDGLSVQRAPNEKVAFEVALGISRGGARVLVALRHDGLNIASDPLVASAYAGVGGGIVVVSIDDPGVLATTNEQDTRHVARAAKLPMLAPSNAQEIVDFVRLGFSLSEQYDTPVIVRVTTRLCYTAALAGVEPRTDAPRRPKTGTASVDALTRHTHLEKQLTAVEAFGTQAFELNTIDVGSPDVGIVTSGIAYTYAREVMPAASFLKLGMIHPLPQKLLAYFASLVKRVYVVEELDPFLEEQIRAMGIAVTGKDAFPRTGELTPDIVASGLSGEGVGAGVTVHAAVELPARQSSLCLGCSHRGLMNVFQRMNLTVVGDVGCYTPGDVPPSDPSEVDACFCIGASMSVAYGMALASGEATERNTVAVLSGATFMHSGLPALANIARNGGTAVVCLLAAPSARTQDDGLPVDYRKLCEGVGVTRIRDVHASDETAIEAALREEFAADGVSVLISVQ